jgi:hypothetical protein
VPDTPEIEVSKRRAEASTRSPPRQIHSRFSPTNWRWREPLSDEPARNVRVYPDGEPADARLLLPREVLL